MIEAMVRRGDAVTVWNRTASKARALERLGAEVAATSGDAVADRRIGAFLPRLRSTALVVDHSTPSPRGTVARARRLQQAGVRFLHAPVFMSPQMARESIGLMMASGPQPVFEAARGDLQ